MIKIVAPISVGELLDKISILQIKLKYTDNEYIKKEIDELISKAEEKNVYNLKWLNELYHVNKLLWEVEDKIRVKEANNSFDVEFIALARQVYINNDKRAEIKKQINELTNSEFREIKLY